MSAMSTNQHPKESNAVEDDNAAFWTVNADPSAVLERLPQGEIAPPFSPSRYELLTTCGRRAAFAQGRKVAGLTYPKARLGTAFHALLEEAGAASPIRDALGPRAFRQWAQDTFLAHAEKQKREAALSPRERRLPWPDKLETEFVVKAVHAAQALRTPQKGPSASDEVEVPPVPGADRIGEPTRFRERSLVSRDGLLHGRPDRIDLTPTETEIVDYKTGSVAGDENRARYRRQGQIYAALLYETEGVWAARFRLDNPTTNESAVEIIEPEEATATADSVKNMARALSGSKWRDLPALPGAACVHCPYRPYCPEYWAADTADTATPVADDPSPFHDLEGVLLRMEWPQSGDEGRMDVQSVASAPESIAISFAASAFAHLKNATKGAVLRILNARQKSDGSEQQLRLTTMSEAFIVVNLVKPRGLNGESLPR